MIEIVQTQSVHEREKNTEFRLENYYHITKVTEVELMTVKEAMHQLALKYGNSILQHRKGCRYEDLKTYEGCTMYGDGEVKKERTCVEDLMFLYEQMGKIHQWIYSVEELGL